MSSIMNNDATVQQRGISSLTRTITVVQEAFIKRFSPTGRLYIINLTAVMSFNRIKTIKQQNLCCSESHIINQYSEDLWLLIIRINQIKQVRINNKHMNECQCSVSKLLLCVFT